MAGYIECRECTEWFYYDQHLDPDEEIEIIRELRDDICPECKEVLEMKDYNRIYGEQQ